MVTQNLYVVYQDGYIEEYGKDLEMEISLLSFYTQIFKISELSHDIKFKKKRTKKASLKYSSKFNNAAICGHFPIFVGTFLNIFLGSYGSTGLLYNTSLGEKSLTESEIPKRLNLDASSVQFGNHFWIFGGTVNCGNSFAY